MHASPLLDALVLCFESLWAQATPIGATAGAARPRSATRTAPAVDARRRAQGPGHRPHPGVTERTVGRRIQELMGQLKATTRFQAGLQAARRGWL